MCMHGGEMARRSRMSLGTDLDPQVYALSAAHTLVLCTAWGSSLNSMNAGTFPAGPGACARCLLPRGV